MTDQLGSIFSLGASPLGELGFLSILGVVALSLAASLFLSYLYVTFYENRATGSQIHRSFPLIGISITVIFIAIQFSLPLSLGLLGALSIVRFRTPIKEPEEIGFILLVVAASLSCATFRLTLLAILMLLAVGALLLLRFGPRLFGRSLDAGMTVITLPASAYQEKANEILSFLDDRLPQGKLDSIVEHGGETAISYSFGTLDRRTLVDLQPELQRISDHARASVFFNCPTES